MRKSIYITLLIAGFMFGCNSGYLEKTNQNSINVKSFYKTQEDAILAVNGAYSVLQHRGLYKRQYFTLDYVSGDFTITEGGFQYSNLPGFRFLPSEDNLVFSTWNTCYLGVARSNVVIDKVPGIDMDDDLKNRIVAEARFLRGLYNFHLVAFYGGIPILKSVVDSPGDDMFKPKRSSLDESWQAVVDDFKFAAANLPNFDEYEDSDVGRASAGAAQGFLGKAYLYWGKFQEARDAFAPIVAGTFGPYKLVDFEDNFTDANENNDESLFEVQFRGGLGNVWAGDDTGGETESTYQGTEFGPRRFANAFPSDDINDFFDQFPEEEAVRRPMTIARAGDTWRSWDPIVLDDPDNYPWNARIKNAGGSSAIRKNNLGPDETQLQSSINVRLLRYADVLLMFAEAENEVNGATSAAYSAVKEVRDRAQVSEWPAGLSKDEFRQRIKDERRLELSFEQLRYFDLIRWGDGEEMPGFTSGKNEVFPIPESELILNPDLGQNPNW